MAKFCLSDSETVIASLKDPVAVDCISKLAAENTGNNNTAAQRMIEDDRSVSLIAQSLSPRIVDLPSCAVVSQDPSPVVAPVCPDPPECGVKLLSEGVVGCSQTQSVPSEIPLFIASHDLLSLPLITLPLVACSIASSNDVLTVNPEAVVNDTSEKPFITVATTAAIGELNSPPENVAMKPIYRTL